MITLFSTPKYTVDTAKFSNLLHDKVVTELEQEFAKYVGAAYACTANSASSLIYLAMREFAGETVEIPSVIPPVVPNAVINAGCKIRFIDHTHWVGGEYCLHKHIYDSAHAVDKFQYRRHNNSDILIFSFYPTKPVGGCDGGIAVSNNKDYIDFLRKMTLNGTEYSENSWERKQSLIGYKMHCNSIQADVALQSLRNLPYKKQKLQDIRIKYNNRIGAFENCSDHLFRISVDQNQSFIKKMGEVGIQCGIHYPACHNKEPFKDHTNRLEVGSMVRSIMHERANVSIPFHENLTNEETNKVIEYVRKFANL